MNNSFHNGLLRKLTDEIDSDIQQNSSLHTQCITICSECKVPSNRHDNTARDIIRAHPNYRSGDKLDNSKDEEGSPWHDWVEVEYQCGPVCGKVLLWCWIHFTSVDEVDQNYALVQTLKGEGKSLRHISICQSCDSFDYGSNEIQFVPGNAVKSVAYVLPSINHEDSDRDNYDQYFNHSPYKNRHFMVIKPVESWS